MSLVKKTLQTQLNNIIKDSPKNLQDGILRWADAIDTYAKEVNPSSTTNEEAKTIFISTMQSIPSGGLSIFESAIIAYAAQLGVGMAPNYTSTPPPTPIVLQSISLLGLNGGSNKQCTKLTVDIIDAYFRTGTAVDVSSNVSNWS